MVKKTKKTKTPKTPKVIITTGKRKSAIARARINAGTGRVLINSKPLELWGTELLRMRIEEPLILSGELAKKVDIDVNVRSGGTTGQTDAIRMSIARALVEFSKDRKLKERFLKYDRNLLVFDVRRTEPHKPSRSRKGARRHKQRSKR